MALSSLQLLAATSPTVPSTEGRREDDVCYCQLLRRLMEASILQGKMDKSQGEIGSPIPILLDMILSSLESSPMETGEWMISGNICQVHVENSIPIHGSEPLDAIL